MNTEILKARLIQPVSHTEGPQGLVDAGRPRGHTDQGVHLAQGQRLWPVVLTAAGKSR